MLGNCFLSQVLPDCFIKFTLYCIFSHHDSQTFNVVILRLRHYFISHSCTHCETDALGESEKSNPDCCTMHSLFVLGDDRQCSGNVFFMPSKNNKQSCCYNFSLV